MLTILIPVFVFSSVVLLVVAVGTRRRPSVLERVNLYRASRVEAPLPPDLTESILQRTFWPMLDRLADRIGAVLPSSMLENLDLKLNRAGRPMGIKGFLVLWMVSGLFLPTLIFAALLMSGEAATGMNRLIIAGSFGLGLAAPYVWLTGRVSRRQATIIKSLPDAFDLVTTCVEAGLGFDAALTRVASRVPGPFGEELGRTLREVGMGRPRREALRDLGERTGVADLQTFVNAVVQAEQMGVSIGQVLRVQADQMRVRRRQRAEQQAYKAPVKMVFPLVLFIFPSLFVVLLGPAIISAMETLGQ